MMAAMAPRMRLALLATALFFVGGVQYSHAQTSTSAPPANSMRLPAYPSNTTSSLRYQGSQLPSTEATPAANGTPSVPGQAPTNDPALTGGTVTPVGNQPQVPQPQPSTVPLDAGAAPMNQGEGPSGPGQTQQLGFDIPQTPNTNVPSQLSPPPPPPPSNSPMKSEVVDVRPNASSKRRTLAIIRTSMGNFTVELFPRQAPRTVQNFIDLAKGEREFIDAKTGRKVRRPFYNGLIFHRALKNFIVQAGCPFGTGKGGPGYTVPDEFTPALRHRRAGMVSMANAGQPDTNGSQFLITLSPQPDFDDKYTIFGEVIQGMDVVRDIARQKVGPTDRPIRRIYIVAIDIVEE